MKKFPIWAWNSKAKKWEVFPYNELRTLDSGCKWVPVDSPLRKKYPRYFRQYVPNGYIYLFTGKKRGLIDYYVNLRWPTEDVVFIGLFLAYLGAVGIAVGIIVTMAHP